MAPACSGGMKFGDPSTWPVTVMSQLGDPASAGPEPPEGGTPNRFAKPKSVTRG